MQNPITQLKQHKTAQNAANNGIKAKSKVNTPPEQKQAQNAIEGGNKLAYQPMTQVRYIFQQAKWNAANCKVNHPDCFHLKKQMQRGANRICKNLAITDRLLAELAENIVMTEEQKTTLKRVKNTVQFLRSEFKGVVDYVKQVEQAEGEALNALCYRNTSLNSDEERTPKLTTQSED